ncbi:Non-specific serine/threonine protein kinase [Sulfidibacter corallicola]|uniref:Serine/threonine protein kinase n=1 Tax=Sulfidibacter corallicola TaxID=2818388 RepID=A0A8A4TW78_SULCO|nr:serine/threonine-protein kinase [Sulfidibacter corallicola]QTD53428.1 serine/threonine protein kinase [Sulfidibacter corallicola]
MRAIESESRWLELRRLFEQGLPLSQPERRNLLRERCGDDSELARELTRMWAEVRSLSAESCDLLNQPRLVPWELEPSAWADWMVDFLPAEDEVRAGGDWPVLPGYQVAGRLGQGGMGEVYKVVQGGHLQRFLAVKVLARKWCRAAYLPRFYAEQGVLASLNHPNIVFVVDSGKTAEGRPFFAMEYVHGPSITRYCAERDLATRDRIALMLPLVKGIDHVHRKGVIHRDIKPANVLVGETDGQPVPKIIDFGIAKLGASLASGDRPVGGVNSGCFGTPSFMSPEQALGRAANIDARCDQYALGLILLELLAGNEARRAHAARVARRFSASIGRSPVRHADFPGMDLDVALSAEDLLARLDPEIRAIIYKATAALPADRYVSCEAFAADLSRYLDHRPVAALPPSPLYGTVKWLHRNRVAVSAVCAVFLVLLLVSGTSLWKMERHRQEVSSLETAQFEAERRAHHLNELSRALVKLSDPIDGYAADPPDEARRPVLPGPHSEAYWRQVSARLGLVGDADPGMEATLRTQLGTTMHRAGNPTLAKEELNRALRLHDEDRTGDVRGRLQLRGLLAFVCAESGELREAEAHYREAWREARAHFGKTDSLTLALAGGLATAWRDAGRLRQAEELLRATLATQVSVLPDDDSRTTATRNNLAHLLVTTGHLTEAEDLLSTNLMLHRESRGEDHPFTSSARHNMCELLHRRGELIAAETGYRRVLADRTHHLGPLHPDTLTTRNNLAVVLADQGRMAEAFDLLATVFADARQKLGDPHPVVLLLGHGMGDALVELGLPDQAEPVLERALRGRRVVFGSGHLKTLRTRFTLGQARTAMGCRNEGLAEMQAALRMAERRLGSQHPDTRLYRRYLERLNAATIASRLD